MESVLPAKAIRYLGYRLRFAKRTGAAAEFGDVGEAPTVEQISSFPWPRSEHNLWKRMFSTHEPRRL